MGSGEAERRERSALVTGAGRGIGRAVALAFARAGMRVIVGARSHTEIERVAEECRALGVSARAYALDVTDRRSCESAVQACLGTMGSLDVLVNNAGIATAQKFTATTEEVWNRTLQVNLTGAFLMTQAALPAMLEQGGGRVIAISSIAARIGGAYIAPYAASKHGLLGLMRSLAAEYARTSLTFNCVCPAYTDTPMTEASVRRIMGATGRTREQALAALLTPQGRLIDPEEVAAACVFLASDAAGSITGQAINIDGGYVQS